MSDSPPEKSTLIPRRYTVKTDTGRRATAARREHVAGRVESGHDLPRRSDSRGNLG